MAAVKQVVVGQREIVARINRALIREAKAQGNDIPTVVKGTRAGTRSRREFGKYYFVVGGEYIEGRDLDIEAQACDLKCIQPHETIEGWTQADRDASMRNTICTTQEVRGWPRHLRNKYALLHPESPKGVKLSAK